MTLVERRPWAYHPRARRLNVRTIEILRALGLEAAVLEAGVPLARSALMLFVETLAGREVRRVPEADLVIAGEVLAPLQDAASSASLIAPSSRRPPEVPSR